MTTAFLSRLGSRLKSLWKPRFPPSLIGSDVYLTPRVIESIRESVCRLESGESKLLFLEPGMSFYQFVNGRWEPVIEVTTLGDQVRKFVFLTDQGLQSFTPPPLFPSELSPNHFPHAPTSSEAMDTRSGR